MMGHEKGEAAFLTCLCVLVEVAYKGRNVAGAEAPRTTEAALLLSLLTCKKEQNQGKLTTF
jgi:hypothetical protein